MPDTELDKAIEKIIIHKANNMISSRRLTRHIKDFLRQCAIVVNMRTDTKEIFMLKVSAVDAMIRDVAQALGFAGRIPNVHDDWTSHDRRMKTLKKIFPNNP